MSDLVRIDSICWGRSRSESTAFVEIRVGQHEQFYSKSEEYFSKLEVPPESWQDCKVGSLIQSRTKSKVLVEAGIGIELGWSRQFWPG